MEFLPSGHTIVLRTIACVSLDLFWKEPNKRDYILQKRPLVWMIGIIQRVTSQLHNHFNWFNAVNIAVNGLLGLKKRGQKGRENLPAGHAIVFRRLASFIASCQFTSPPPSSPGAGLAGKKLLPTLAHSWTLLRNRGDTCVYVYIYIQIYAYIYVDVYIYT